MVPHGHKLIPQSQSKGCPLDPIPTSLLKSCSDTLTPVNTGVVNQSLPTGSVPECFKQAQVTPLLKKPGLDKNALENHCPVSNCHFFQDFLRVILVEHIINNNLLELKQSAYRQHHSTETALLHVTNCPLYNTEQGQVSILTLLGISAALDNRL